MGPLCPRAPEGDGPPDVSCERYYLKRGGKGERRPLPERWELPNEQLGEVCCQLRNTSQGSGGPQGPGFFWLYYSVP